MPVDLKEDAQPQQELRVLQTQEEKVVIVLEVEEALVCLEEAVEEETMTVQLVEVVVQLLELSKQLDLVQAPEITPMLTMLVMLVRVVVVVQVQMVMVAMETQVALC